MEFDFDASFKLHSKIGLEKMNQALQELSKTETNKDELTLAMIQQSSALCLTVTRFVFQDYHEFLKKTVLESR